MTVSPPLPLIAENIPLALREGKRFTGWRSEPRKDQPKPAKVPYSPDSDDKRKLASSTAPGHWLTFAEAIRYAELAGLDGIMRAFDASDGLVGIDLDNCRDPETGELTPEAAERIKRADTYTEISPTGTGIKMWMYGTLPPGRRKLGDVEMYNSARFFTMTGHQLEGTPASVGYRPDFVLAFHREVFGDAPDVTVVGDGDLDRPVPALTNGDEDVIRLADASRHNGERFRRLWSGDTSAYAVDGNAGASEALAALVELIVYYGGPDLDRVDRLVRRSGLYTEKWERPDIRKRAFNLAMRGRTRFYGDSIQAQPAPAGDGTDTCPCETCPSRDRVKFLERRLLDHDDEQERDRETIRAQQVIVRTERAEKEAFRAKLAEIRDLMAIPSKRLSYAAKCLAVVLDNVFEATADYRADPENTRFVQVRYGDLATKLGGSESTVAREMNKTLCTDVKHPTINAGAPVLKNTTFIERVIDGELRPTSETTIALKADTSMLSATLRYQPDEERKHGGARTPGCPKPECDGADLIIRSTTHCAKCGDQIGPARETLRHQADVLGAPPTPPVDDGYSGQQVDVLGGNDGAEQSERAAKVIPIRRRDHHAHVEISEEVERRDLDLTGRCQECQQEPSRAPWRCHCGSLERYPRSNGGYRCEGCGEVTLPAVAGAEE